MQLVGGFANQPTTACKQALKEYLKQKKLNVPYFYVDSCSIQVVAGRNYRMKVFLKGYVCNLKIYRDLSDIYKRISSEKCRKYEK